MLQTGRQLLALGLLAAVATPAAFADGGVFVEQNGIVSIHMESNPPAGWAESTSTPGFTGESYYVWNGPDLFQQPGVQGLINFDILISTQGTYTLNLRNRHDHPNPTEANDIWVKMDNGPWEKVFSNGYTSLPYVGHWSWEARTEHSGYPQATYWLSTGMHRLQFSARSNGFKVDKVHLTRPTNPNATNENFPQSPRIVGDAYGTAVPNSAGLVGQLRGLGTSFASESELTLEAYNLPVGHFGIFLASRTQGFTPNPGNSNGNLLLGANFARVPGVFVADANGRVTRSLDLSALPVQGGVVAAQAGQTWNFQFMHREQGSSNFTRGLTVTFE